MSLKIGPWLKRAELLRLGRLEAKFCTASTYKYLSEDDDFSSTPKYPPIEKTDLMSEEERLEKEWHDKIKRQLTVEEKLFEVNVPRHYGWKCFMIHEGIVPYNNLDFCQHVTRTHLIENENLPKYYDKFSQKSLALASQIKNVVLDSIEYQLDVRSYNLSKITESTVRDKEIAKIIVTELNSIITKSLWAGEQHLKFMQLDFNPRIETSWKINSLVETVVKKEYKHGIPLNELPEEYLDRPSDKYIQYIGHPILQLRNSHPLHQLIDHLEANIFTYSVPVYKFDPYVSLGYRMERRHTTNIPGFWPGDSREYSFLSYHSSNYVKHRPASYCATDRKDALHSQAIFASFGWLFPLACYHGFSSYHDVTYPFVTQTVLTDGQEFLFACFQLNTSEMYHKNAFENPRCNICWITPALPLFEAYENGKLKGFNEQVLVNLIKFYVNSPNLEKNINEKPYLGDDIKCVAHYEDEEKRQWLERMFKEVSGNKKKIRPDLVYEVNDWERIFKIQFRMRPRDARKRPFELRQNPYHKNMSDWKGDYIPRALRPDKDLPKWRQRKYKKTFFPQ